MIVDTAGRLHTQTNLMDELAKVRRVIAGRREGAPHEVLLVVDATTGQNGLQQARLFNDAVGVTGVALTKLDGSAKGGIAVAIAYELGLPVKLVGVGEGLDDLRPFDADDFARALVADEPCPVGHLLVRRARGALHAGLRGLLRARARRRADAPLHGRQRGTSILPARVWRPVRAFCNLAVRGDRAWIGGICVVPEARRKGLGRALMEAVLELAPPTVLLEVIEENEPAITLYEAARLRAHARARGVVAGRAPLVAAETARPTGPLGQTDLPWQREDASLPPDYERVEVDGGAMLFRGAHGVPARGARRGRGGCAALSRVPDGAQLRERPGRRRRDGALAASAAAAA